MKHEEENKSNHIQSDMKLSAFRNLVVGEDLFLRPLFASDNKYLYDIYADAENMKHFGSGKASTLDQVDKSTIARAAYPEGGRIYYWLFVTHLGAEGVVCINRHKGKPQITVPEKTSQEIKSKIRDLEENYDKEVIVARSPKFPGRMMATKAIKMMTEFIGGDFFATVSPKNEKSRVMLSKRVGFKKCEDIGEVPMYGSSREFYVYSASTKEKNSHFVYPGSDQKRAKEREQRKEKKLSLTR